MLEHTDSQLGSSSTRKLYRATAVEVSFDGARCRHAAECLRGLPAVFDGDRRPWIYPDGADPDDVVDVVARCPDGVGPKPAGATAFGPPLQLRGSGPSCLYRSTWPAFGTT